MLETPKQRTKLLKTAFSGNEIERLDSSVNKQKNYKYIFLRLAEQLLV